MKKKIDVSVLSVPEQFNHL